MAPTYPGPDPSPPPGRRRASVPADARADAERSWWQEDATPPRRGERRTDWWTEQAAARPAAPTNPAARPAPPARSAGPSRGRPEASGGGPDAGPDRGRYDHRRTRPAVESWVDVEPPEWQLRSDLPEPGTARRLAAGILLLLAGLAGLLPLALPFGVGHPSGWAAITYYAGSGASLPSAIGIGLVAVAALGLTCVGVLLLLPGLGDRIRGRAAGTIAIGFALIAVVPALWLAAASDLRLGGMSIGTYSFLCSGLIGLVAALPALSGRRNRGRAGRAEDRVGRVGPSRSGGGLVPGRVPARTMARQRDHDQAPWGLR